MKKRKWSILAMMAAIMMLMLAACNSSTTNNNASTGNNNNGGGGGGETGTVNIGYSGPLSGPAAYYGERTLNGVKMAAEEINNSGGFEVNGKTYKLNIVSLDDKYLPNETAANAKRLVQEHQTPIIFTPHSGGVMALQVFNQTDNFIIAAYTSEPKITQTGNKLTVRILPRYDGYIPTFTDYAMKRFGKKLAALPTATQYGKDWTEKLLPYWEKQGGEVVYKSSIDFTKDTDFFAIVTNALKEKPDVLFIGGPSEPTAKVAKQARELGFKGGFIIMDQAKLDEMQRTIGSYEILEGSIGVMPLIHSDQPGAPEFAEKYRTKFNAEASSESGYNYLALYAFVEAMKAAGTVDDPMAIREHLNEGLKNIPKEKQVYVVPSVGDDGGFESEIVVAAVENGKVVPIELIDK
ncbi:ABC transporter substrate-binding protein [Geobacillus stearothermophilus]|nr:ABC transporter substrate-binding protein [Geobacillus stearothermophilus]